MHKYSYVQVGKSQILKWHYENVVVACLSADEVHKAPGDPQDKLALLKIIKTIKRKHQETFWKLPENLDSKEKSHLFGAVRFLYIEHNAKINNAFGLIDKKLWLLEGSWNLNEFEINNK